MLGNILLLESAGQKKCGNGKKEKKKKKTEGTTQIIFLREVVDYIFPLGKLAVVEVITYHQPGFLFL